MSENKDLKQYQVTEKAGQRVAGFKIQPGQMIELTDHQAAYELMNGAVILDQPDKKNRQKASQTKGKNV